MSVGFGSFYARQDAFAEDSFLTPESSPRREDAEEFLTPITGAKRKLSEIQPDSDLTRRENEAVEEGIRKIQRLPDTPGKTKSSAVRNLSQIFEESVTGGPKSPAKASGQLALFLSGAPNLTAVHKALYKMDQEIEHKAEDLPGPTPPINYQHILKPIATGGRALGWHFCPTDHPNRGKLQDVTYSINGVFCASFSLSPDAPKKRSSFFPERVRDLTMLHKILGDASPVASCKNRVLSSTSLEGLYIERYLERGHITKTAFPLFSYETWNAEQEFRLTENYSITSGELLQIANDNQLDPKYRMGENVVLDFGTRLRGLNVPQGIFFVFPSNVLTYEFFED
ncbi:MAG: hypothetical protein JSS61_04125 [Verrucomicrobia bacterium]|nr:hypothetical protein [Verrucomicrobiota bacterium]